MRTYNETPALFLPVAEAIKDAHLIAWDGCHKMYLAMDEEEAEWFTENYEFVVNDTAEVMLTTLMGWWDESCSLRFVSAVRHNPDDPNAGFTNLISQFEDTDEENLFDDEEDLFGEMFGEISEEEE